MQTGITNNLTIETPESVGFTYQVADIGSRFLALLIDTLIQFGAIILLILAARQLRFFELENLLPAGMSSQQAVAIVLVVVFLLYVAYFAAFEIAWQGRTPGKRIVKLRVVKENGYPLSPLDVLLRNLVRLVDFFPSFYGLGVLVMLLNKRARRLGDLAAGTLVVRLRDEVKLNQLLAAVPVAVQEALPLDVQDTLLTTAIDAVRELTSEDAQLIESFLARGSALTNREALAARITEAIEARLHSPELEAQTANMTDEDGAAPSAASARNRT